MGQVFVRASRRAKAYTRNSPAVMRFTAPAHAKRPSALRALKSANKFIARGHGNNHLRRQLIEYAKADRVKILKVIAEKRLRGRKVYRSDRLGRVTIPGS